MMRFLSLLLFVTGLGAVEFQVASLTAVADKTDKVVYSFFGSHYELGEDSQITIGDITSASVEKRGDTNLIVITLNDAGAQKIRSFTTRFVKRQFAIMVDKKCVSAPTIVAPTTVGRIVFTLESEKDDAEAFARNIRSGIVSAGPKQ